MIVGNMLSEYIVDFTRLSFSIPQIFVLYYWLKEKQEDKEICFFLFFSFFEHNDFLNNMISKRQRQGFLARRATKHLRGWRACGQDIHFMER